MIGSTIYARNPMDPITASSTNTTPANTSPTVDRNGMRQRIGTAETMEKWTDELEDAAIRRGLNW